MSAINNIASAIPTVQELENIREANLVRKYNKNQDKIDKFVNWVSSEMKSDPKTRHFIFGTEKLNEFEEVIIDYNDVLSFLFNKRGWYIKNICNYRIKVEIKCL